MSAFHEHVKDHADDGVPYGMVRIAADHVNAR